MSSNYDSIWVPLLTANFLTSYEGVLENQWSYDLARRVETNDEFLKPVDVDSVGSVQLFNNNMRTYQKPNVYTLIQQNLPYHLTMQIDVEDVKRDKIGLFESRVSEMGAKFADHVNRLVVSNITAGSSTNCFDGTPFFGTSHPVNGTTQANICNATGSGGAAALPQLLSSNYTGSTAAAPTAVQMSNVIMGIVGYFYAMIDNAGDPINGGAKGFKFVTSNPAVWGAFVAAIDSYQLSQGQTNIVFDLQSKDVKYTDNPKNYQFHAMLDPRLGSATSTTFYAFRTDSEVKPFVWGEEEGLEIQYLGDGSDMAVKENKYLWGAKAVRSVGVGRYQHALSCTLS